MLIATSKVAELYKNEELLCRLDFGEIIIHSVEKKRKTHAKPNTEIRRHNIYEYVW